jgi:hypothetical protein
VHVTVGIIQNIALIFNMLSLTLFVLEIEVAHMGQNSLSSSLQLGGEGWLCC